MKRTLHANVDTKSPVKDGETRPFRYPFLAPGEPLVSSPSPDILTVRDLFFHNYAAHKHLPCLGSRTSLPSTTTGEDTQERKGPYAWHTYEQLHDHIHRLGHHLMTHHAAQPLERIGIYGNNTAEWVTVDLTCATYRFISVPLYDTLGIDALCYIIQQTDMRILFLASSHLPLLLPHLSQLPTLTTLILLDKEEGEKKEAKEPSLPPHISLLTLNSLLLLNPENHSLPSPSPSPSTQFTPSPQDTLTICYTSGTTGMPKGVVLSHANMVADVAAVLRMSDDQLVPFRPNPNEVHLSYLPLAHMFERVVICFMLHIKSRIAFYNGNVLHLLDDVQAVKPTLFVSVPRLLNRMHTRIRERVAAKGTLAQTLFHYALRSKLHTLRTTGHCVSPFWDLVLFHKLRDLLGGRVKGIVSGAAPANGDVLDFLSVCFSCPAIEGYGQTETSAGATLAVVGDPKRGHVGVPMPCNELKLVDIPEMGYRVTDQPCPRGEICFRGNNVLNEYYRQPIQTSEALIDGWLHTGDVGTVDREGRVTIIDRKKHLFKLAQGEYVAPEKIEQVYAQSPLVSQIFVHGESTENHVVAIVVPDPVTLVQFAAKQRLLQECSSSPESAAAALEGWLQQQPLKVNELLLEELQQCGKKSDLKGFEQVKAIHVQAQPFSEDLYTPTLKLKRHQVKQHYKDTLAQLYHSK